MNTNDYFEMLAHARDPLAPDAVFQRHVAAFNERYGPFETVIVEYEDDAWWMVRSNTGMRGVILKPFTASKRAEDI